MISSSKEQYIKICETHNSIPLFLQPWWMDAVCNNGEWGVLILEENNSLFAIWVFHTRKKVGKTLIIQPQLTQYNGIWFHYPENYTKNNKIAFEKRATKELIAQLDEKKYDYFSQNFHFSIKNWLPLYWEKFKQTTRYTYQIKDISNPEKCYENFSYAKQKQIKKSISTLKSLEINEEQFYNLLEKDHFHKNEKVSYSRQFFYHLYKECKQQNQGRIIAMADAEHNIHAALFIVWDKKTAYNLISAINPKYKSSGGSSLVVYEAIKQMSNKVKVFDFEGSMIEGVENSFRQFGTEQIPYFNIYKYNSFLLKAYFEFIKQ